MYNFSLSTDECTFGDYKGQLSSGQTCAEMVHDSPWLCYRDPESQKCCGSCARIADDNDQGKELVCRLVTLQKQRPYYTNGASGLLYWNKFTPCG